MWRTAFEHTRNRTQQDFGDNLKSARDMAENIIIKNFGKEYENVADFEQKHNVKLPEDIAALLTPSVGIAGKQKTAHLADNLMLQSVTPRNPCHPR